MKYIIAVLLMIIFNSCLSKSKNESQKALTFKSKESREEISSLDSLKSMEKNMISVSNSLKKVKEENQIDIRGKNGDISLVYKDVLSGALRIKIPQTFVPMSREDIKVKYPQANPDNITVYSNQRGTINILLNISDVLLENELSSVLFQTTERLKKVKGLSIEKSEVKKINNKEVAIIAFNSQAVDTRIYNLMFITDINGKTFTGNYNCTYEHLSKWKDIGAEIVNSLVVL